VDLRGPTPAERGGAVRQLHCERRSVLGENRRDAATNRQRQTNRAKCIEVAPAELTVVHVSSPLVQLTSGQANSNPGTREKPHSGLLSKTVIFRPYNVLSIRSFQPAHGEMTLGRLLEMLDKQIVHGSTA
jgi:hypothetical protein